MHSKSLVTTQQGPGLVESDGSHEILDSTQPKEYRDDLA
jgi:hypothetical protein